MKRIALISVLLALVLSLSGCKKEEEPVEVSSLAVIEPESTEEFVDRLEDPTVSTLEIGEAPSAIYNIEGKQMDESEYFAYQESLQADEEQPTDSDGNNIPGGFANPLVETELSEDGSLADYKINEPAETQTEPESLSEEQAEELESNINDFTYKQAVENQRIACKYDLAELRKSNPEFADITDEMVDNYSEDELDALVQKIMKAKGF